ncbi:tetratricopeptide repeat protein [Azospirillum sp. ST 5-10]|uniref:tetratricopeptide repeat protein n=1 Tax=unclassified Azospirillum TaxID=2630922 RepID=UPI003F4A3A57
MQDLLPVRPRPLLPRPGDLVARALGDHRAGRVRPAGGLYRTALAVEPGFADALHLLGLVELQSGRAGVAVAWLRRALRSGGERAAFRNSLGEARRLLGGAAAAADSYRRALVDHPAYGEAHRNLGIVLAGIGEPADARAALIRAVILGQEGLDLRLTLAGMHRLAGDAAAARDTLSGALRLAPADPAVADRLAEAERAAGDARMGAGDHAAAAACYRRAVALRPAFVEAMNNLGGACLGMERHDEAETLYLRSLRVRPDYPDAHNNRACALLERGRLDVAARSLRRSVAACPDAADSHANLAYLGRLEARDRPGHAAAEALCRRALRLNPRHPVALNNLGIIALDLGRLAEAETAFRAVLEVRPDDADAHFNLSLVLLKSGRLAEGWEEYEWRWRTRQLAAPTLGRPPWQGEDPAGRTILLHAEQGHGDTLHFVRYAPLLAARGARVVLLVQPALKRLVARLPGLAAVCGAGETLPAFDRHAPLMSLPRLFGTTLDSIPAACPYLSAPAEAVARWEGRLPQDGRVRVGLVWSGDPRPGVVRANLTDRRRSVPLDAFAPFARIPGVRFVSLQKGAAAAQAKTPPPGMDLVDWMDEAGDFADTAGLVERLDLVITVDTSVAHLAGGLGKPVWVLSRFDSCWRWLEGREDSPWYPTLRFFRQPAPGDWDGLFERVAGELAALAGGDRGRLLPARPGRPVPSAAGVPETMPEALALHRAGRTAEAAAAYRRMLVREPGHGDALHLLAAAELAEGRPAVAAEKAAAARRMNPEAAIYHNTLGEACRMQGKPAAAAAHYRRAVALRPDYPDALRNIAGLPVGDGGGGGALAAARALVRVAPVPVEPLAALGRMLRRAGRPGAARAAFRAALAQRPDHADVLDHLAALERAEGNVPAAAACQRHAVVLTPSDAGAHNNRGTLACGDGRPEEAGAWFRRALTLDPALAEAWRNLGIACSRLVRLDEAASAYRRAVAVDPCHADALHGAADVRRQQGRFAEAAATARQALMLRPDHAEAMNTLGVAQQCRGELPESAATLARVLVLRPGDAVARFNLSLSLLRSGDYGRGWRHYEARWEMPDVPTPPVTVPRWHGEDPAGRTILLHAEQGHGDTLQFVRYAPLLARRGARVVLTVQPALTRLLRAVSGVAAVHGMNDSFGGFDLHCPMMSLPLACGTTVTTIPDRPYLTVRREWQAPWATRLAGERRARVGLVWAGDPRPHIAAAHVLDRRRSLTLAALAPLAGVRGVRFVSLQKGAAADQARHPPPGMELTDWMDEVGDFADTAGLIAELDLVVTVDTSVAHLAGGLGKPVWVLSRYDACWRWLVDREDSPWYPTLRLYRQDGPGDWRPAVDRLAADLERWARRHGGGHGGQSD